MRDFPLRYAYQNILVGRADERAALFRLDAESYPYKPDGEKLTWLRRLAHFAFAVEADFSLWRVNRAFPAHDYLDENADLVDERNQRRDAWLGYLDGHRERLEWMSAHVPEVYLAVSTTPAPPASLGGALMRSLDRARRRTEGMLGVGAAQPIAGSELDALVVAEERAFGRVAAAFGAHAHRATTAELQWLLRRAACRGLPDPPHDPHWRPNALVVESDDGRLAYEPLETDVLSCANAPVLEEDRTLVIENEQGTSFQALLALGPLPEEADFPDGAELLFEPLEAVDFPVDAALHAKWIGNRDAVSQVRKRIMDADNTFADEMMSEHGPLSWQAESNRELARELDAYLKSQARPPLLHACTSLAVGASSRKELEQRVEALRDLYSPVALYRSMGLQPRLWFDHLPRAGGAGVQDYGEVLTIEQFGALMPVGTNSVGSLEGPYIGETISGGRRPVKFDVTAAPRQKRTPSILMAGTLGSGKTIAAEMLAIQAERRGSIICDVDPKPDHAYERLPELEGRVQVIELSADERFRGALDPMRIAPPDMREDFASSYMTELLPNPPGAWQTQIRKAVREVLESGGTSSIGVLELLGRSGDRDAQAAAEALGVWADSGLGRLAFGEGGRTNVHVERPITTIRARGLSLPDAAVAREDYDQAERMSVATLKLVAAYAMRLISGDRTVHKIVLFDEAWFLLGSRDGHRLISQLNRLGRSENATMILATQQLGDVGELENLIGTRFIFGQETVAEAERALRLLGLDPDNRALVEEIRGFRQGRCFMRDLDGRVGKVQIDPVYDHFLELLDTSPAARAQEVAA